MALRLALWAALVGAASAQLADPYQGRYLDEEFAGDVEAGSGTYPSPPSSPDIPESVSITFTTSMDVSDITANITDSIKMKFATAASVDVSLVSVEVTSGSATIMVSIATSRSQASAVTQSLSSQTSTKQQLNTLLSGIVAVTDITSPLATHSMPPSAPPPSVKPDGLSGGAIAGIVIGSVLGGALLLIILYKTVINISESPGNAPLVQGVGGSNQRGAVETYGTEITTSPKGSVDVI